jgi:hypothetical protein
MSIDNLTTNLISVVLGTVTGFLIGYLIIIVFSVESENEYN